MYFNEYVESISVVDSVSEANTQFFHGPGHLLFMAHHVFPIWEAQAALGFRARHIRMWSSASENADDHYLLAFTLLERFPATSGWRIQILSTDFAAGERDANRALDASTMKHSQGEIVKGGPEAAPAVEFHRVNVTDHVSPPGGAFDLIWCGNVLTYFNYEPKTRARVRTPDLLTRRRDRTKTPTQ